jgi:hypothetical protein
MKQTAHETKTNVTREKKKPQANESKSRMKLKTNAAQTQKSCVKPTPKASHQPKTNLPPPNQVLTPNASVNAPRAELRLS